MKSVYLLGDSIRFGAENSPGYGIYVKESLAPDVAVYAPDENCKFASYTLRYLHEWSSNIDKEKIDVVHWNNGLWDVLRVFGDEPFTDLETYGITLKRVYKRIRFLFPNAKVIFALSTAVLEEWIRADFARYNREIELYNKKAEETLGEFDIVFNDLYTVTKNFAHSLRVDGVHYGEVGSKILADKVVEKIKKIL